MSGPARIPSNGNERPLPQIRPQPLYPIKQPILFLQNAAIETPGRLGKLLQTWNIPHETFDLTQGGYEKLEPHHYQAVIPLGGPMNADEDDAYPYLHWEKGFLAQCFDQHVPVLGICLGAQLLARALGAPVHPETGKEIGWLEAELTEAGMNHPLFSGLLSPFWVFQWHSDSFAIPVGGARLATARGCKNQAFHVENRAYGIQFHIEATCDDIRGWAQTFLPHVHPNDRATVRELAEQPNRQRSQAVAHTAELILDRFLRLISSGRNFDLFH